MKTLALVPVFLLAAGHASAEPTQKELEARKASLEEKLKGQGFTVMIEAPFVVIGDEGPAMVKHRATGFLRWTVGLLEKDYFTKRPDKLIEVWLFGNEKTYRKGAKKFFNDEPDTPYGYYSPSADALIMNIGPGAGTLSHELVHPYIEANFPSAPAWFNEGLASLYERPVEKAGHIVGLANWRLPNLKRQINEKKLPALPVMLGTSRSEFYNASFDSYAYARYLLMYLQEQGKLHAFYKKFLADKKDLTGQAALEAVLGTDVATFEPTWRKWVLALQTDGH
ncbi:MAG: hypothetical protein KIT31_43755 [Deltaproteobacteria bacterium]|nr:hypothetical protein [Deltaproteobacteria bacterium]